MSDNSGIAAVKRGGMPCRAISSCAVALKPNFWRIRDIGPLVRTSSRLSLKSSMDQGFVGVASVAFVGAEDPAADVPVIYFVYGCPGRHPSVYV